MLRVPRSGWGSRNVVCRGLATRAGQGGVGRRGGAETLLCHSGPSAARLQRRKPKLRSRSESPGCLLALCAMVAGTFHPPNAAQNVEGVVCEGVCAQDVSGAGTPWCSARSRPRPSFASVSLLPHFWNLTSSHKEGPPESWCRAPCGLTLLLLSCQCHALCFQVPARLSVLPSPPHFLW